MSTRDEDVDREIRSHLDAEVDDRLAAGMSEAEAVHAARRAFGSVALAREEVRAVWARVWLDDLLQDARYGVRALMRNPGFACVAILTFALGVGANTAIFSVINAVLLRPLPFPDADRLVTILENRPPAEPFDGRPARRPPFPDEIRDLQSRTTTLIDLELYGPAPEIRLTGREEEPGLPGARASGPLLKTLGARALLGRLFDTGEQGPVVVLSHEAWQRDFAGDPNIIGRSIIIEEGNVPALRRREPHTIVGVMAPDFAFPNEQVRYWMPRGGGFNVARLRDGVSLDAAASEVSALLHQITGTPVLPAGSQPPRFEVLTVHDRLVAPIRPALHVLGVAVGLVLLIACANVANLLLSRANVRRREMAVRGALGAGRGRLARQMLTESTVLVAAGGAVGIAIALGTLQLLRAQFARFVLPPGRIVRQIGVEFAPTGFPRLEEIGLDATALAYAAGLCVVAGLFFGLTPVMRQPAPDMPQGLRDSAGTPQGLRLVKRNLSRHLLIVGEIAVAMMLLVGGGLMVRSFVGLLTAETGFDASNVLTFQVRRPAARSSHPELVSLSEDLVTALSAAPGVRAAAYAAQLPTLQLGIGFNFRTSPQDPVPPRGAGPAAPATGQEPDVRVVSRDYFDVLGIRLVAGRGFSEFDGPAAPPVLVINRQMARVRFGDRNPLGVQLYGPGPRPWEIVGIVDDVRQEGMDRAPEPQVFMAYRQWPLEGFPLPQYYAVRTGGDPYGVLPAARAALRARDGEATLENIATMEELIAASLARPRTYAVLLGLFALAAVALAAIGIYGILAYNVAQSTREIGIRIALGAERRQVLTLVFGQGMVLTLAGIAIGLAGAFGVTRFLQGMLFGVTPFDAPTFATVVALFAAVAALASIVPARRATRVDPLAALRCE
jgi:putative ABC transport system permease protein